MKLRHKFGSKITVRDGLKFRSKKEARYYDELKLKQKAGIVLFFLRQPRFDLPGGVTAYLDFQVFYSDGRIEFIDVKGMRTKSFVRNKKMIEALYPIEVIEI
jgi:hypothetical protein